MAAVGLQSLPCARHGAPTAPQTLSVQVRCNVCAQSVALLPAQGHSPGRRRRCRHKRLLTRGYRPLHPLPQTSRQRGSHLVSGGELRCYSEQPQPMRRRQQGRQRRQSSSPLTSHASISSTSSRTSSSTAPMAARHLPQRRQRRRSWSLPRQAVRAARRCTARASWCATWCATLRRGGARSVQWTEWMWRWLPAPSLRCWGPPDQVRRRNTCSGGGASQASGEAAAVPSRVSCGAKRLARVLCGAKRLPVASCASSHPPACTPALVASQARPRCCG